MTWIEDLTDWMRKAEEKIKAYDALQQNAAGMEEALRKYADRKNWTGSDSATRFPDRYFDKTWKGPGNNGSDVAESALSVVEHCTEEPSQKNYDPERTEGGPYRHRTFIIPAIERLQDAQRRTCELTITMNAAGQMLGFEVSNVGYEQTQVA